MENWFVACVSHWARSATPTVNAGRHGWTLADEALIDGLVASGHPSTPNYNDPAYPIEGRPVTYAGNPKG